jgi:hypothetical protein
MTGIEQDYIAPRFHKRIVENIEDDEPIIDLMKHKKKIFDIEDEPPSKKVRRSIYLVYFTLFVVALLLTIFFYKWYSKPVVEDCELCKKSEQFNQEITKKEQEIIREKDKNEKIQKQLQDSNNSLRDLGIQLDNIEKRKSIEVWTFGSEAEAAPQWTGAATVTGVVLEEEKPEQPIAEIPSYIAKFIRYPKKEYDVNASIIDHKNISDSNKLSAINIAYQIGGLDFVATLDQENASRDLNRVNDSGLHIGLCQLDRELHNDFIHSPYFNDYENQVLYCYDVRQDAIKKGRLPSTFEGYIYRSNNVSNFIFSP